MMSSDKKIININIPLPSDLYRKLLEVKARTYSRNWVECLEKMIEGEGEIKVQIVTVDGEPPKTHNLTIKLGDYTYSYKGETDEFTMIESSIDVALKMLRSKIPF